VEKVLHDLKIDKDNVHEIVLVGGSMHIPHIITFLFLILVEGVAVDHRRQYL
jgi:hypothetical protein